MTRRILLIVAVLAFLGWLGSLAYTVQKAGTVPVVSKAQFINATHLVVCEITLAEDGKPNQKVLAKELISGEGLTVGMEFVVINLPNALSAGGKSIVPGAYLLLLKKNNDEFRVAGLPRSPGVDATSEGIYRPNVYPWNDEVKAQLRGFGVLK